MTITIRLGLPDGQLPQEREPLTTVLREIDRSKIEPPFVSDLSVHAVVEGQTIGFGGACSLVAYRGRLELLAEGLNRQTEVAIAIYRRALTGIVNEGCCFAQVVVANRDPSGDLRKQLWQALMERCKGRYTSLVRLDTHGTGSAVDDTTVVSRLPYKTLAEEYSLPVLESIEDPLHVRRVSIT
jgi:hypothetical protein